MKLGRIVQSTGADVIAGFDDVEISGVAGLQEAREGEITFLSNPRYTPQLRSTRASAIFVSSKTEVNGGLIALRVADPHLAFARTLRLFNPEPIHIAFVHSTAVIDSTATIAEGVSIGAHAIVGRNVRLDRGVCIHGNVSIDDGARIGEYSVIHSGVAIRENTVIGKRVVVHNNSVIGADGFGFVKDEEGRWFKIPQTGRVVIEDDVEIGACSAIDRSSIGETRIGRGVKIDNLVQIGHSCTVGEDSLLCGQVGLAGSTHVGQRVVLAGQVGVGGHLTIGDDAVMMAQAGTFSDVPPGKVYSGGIPALDHRHSLRVMAAIRKLPETQSRVRELEERVAGLEASKAPTPNLLEPDRSLAAKPPRGS